MVCNYHKIGDWRERILFSERGRTGMKDDKKDTYSEIDLKPKKEIALSEETRDILNRPGFVALAVINGNVYSLKWKCEKGVISFDPFHPKERIF